MAFIDTVDVQVPRVRRTLILHPPARHVRMCKVLCSMTMHDPEP